MEIQEREGVSSLKRGGGGGGDGALTVCWVGSYSESMEIYKMGIVYFFPISSI